MKSETNQERSKIRAETLKSCNKKGYCSFYDFNSNHEVVAARGLRPELTSNHEFLVHEPELFEAEGSKAQSTEIKKKKKHI